MFGKGRLKLIQIEALQVERGGQPGRGERLVGAAVDLALALIVPASVVLVVHHCVPLPALRGLVLDLLVRSGLVVLEHE